MKMFNLYFIMVISTPLFAMNSEEEGAKEEVKKIFTEYKKDEQKLLKEYSDAVIKHQRTPSPENAKRLREVIAKIDSPKLEVKKRLMPAHSEHLDLSKMDSPTFNKIAPYIVRKKGF